jgi:hypothetical protein
MCGAIFQLIKGTLPWFSIRGNEQVEMTSAARILYWNQRQKSMSFLTAAMYDTVESPDLDLAQIAKTILGRYDKTTNGN